MHKTIYLKVGLFLKKGPTNFVKSKIKNKIKVK